jgi:hypothetical protein
VPVERHVDDDPDLPVRLHRHGHLLGCLHPEQSRVFAHLPPRASDLQCVGRVGVGDRVPLRLRGGQLHGHVRSEQHHVRGSGLESVLGRRDDEHADDVRERGVV